MSKFKTRQDAIDRILILSEIHYQIFQVWPSDRIALWCVKNNIDRNFSNAPTDALWHLCSVMEKSLQSQEARQRLTQKGQHDDTSTDRVFQC